MLFAVTIMAVGNVSSVSPAFPRMVEVFGISATQIGWVVTAYSLPGVVTAPLVGILADRIGRKRVLVPTLVVFGLAGGSCALATSFSQLLALRAVQGMAASPLVALSITIISDLYDGRARAAAIGYNATALNVGTASYPAVGGLLAALAWNWPFALPLLALPVAGAVAVGLDAPEIEDERTLAGYLASARTHLTDRRVVGLLLVNFGFFVLLFGAVLTYVPELLDTRYGASSVQVGGLLAIASVVSGLVATQLGRIVDAVSLSRLVQGSLVLIAAALALFPVVPALWGGWAGFGPFRARARIEPAGAADALDEPGSGRGARRGAVDERNDPAPRPGGRPVAHGTGAGRLRHRRRLLRLRGSRSCACRWGRAPHRGRKGLTHAGSAGLQETGRECAPNGRGGGTVEGIPNQPSGLGSAPHAARITEMSYRCPLPG